MILPNHNKSFLDICDAIQKYDHHSKMSDFVYQLYQLLKSVPLNFEVLTFCRLLDADQMTFANHSILADYTYTYNVAQRPNMFALWKQQQTSFRPDVSLPEHAVDLEPNFLEKTQEHWGIVTPCILNLPHAKGILTLRSATPFAFSDHDIDFLRQVVAVLSIAVSRVEDLEHLDQSRTQYENLVNSIDGIIWEADPNTFCFNFVSTTVRQMLGYEAEEWYRDSHFWIDRIHPEERETIVALCNEAIQKGQNHDFEYRFRHKDNSYVWLHDYVSVVTQNERPILLQGVMINTTKHKKYERKLKRFERLNAMGEVSAGISHNLNNILVGVIGPAQLMQMFTDDPDILAEANNIYQAGMQAKELVQRLHKSVHGFEEKATSIDLNSVIDEAIRLSRPRWKDQSEASGHCIEICTDLSPTPNILATHSGLVDIVVNLIFNAVDAISGNGSIILATSSTEKHITLTITDTGIGIAPEVKERIFEPFFTTKANVGTGLGLATVYKQMTDWNGSISVDSEIDKGTTFTLRFPVPTGTEPHL